MGEARWLSMHVAQTRLYAENAKGNALVWGWWRRRWSDEIKDHDTACAVYFSARRSKLQTLMHPSLSVLVMQSPSYPKRHPPFTLYCSNAADRLKGAALDDGRWAILVLDPATLGAAGLDAHDDAHGLLVTGGHTAEDDVTAVEPGGNDGGDEELGSVGVGAGVGHGEHEGLVVGELEVLVGELLAVDGLAAGALG